MKNYLICGGQHIAGMEGEALFPLIKYPLPVKYFTHGGDALSGQSVFYYLTNPFIEETAVLETFMDKADYEPILKELKFSAYPGLKEFTKQSIIKRLNAYGKFFKIDQHVYAEIIQQVEQAETSLGLITRLQQVKVSCITGFQKEFANMNGQIGSHEKWWYIVYRQGCWYRTKSFTPLAQTFPSAKGLFLGLTQLGAGLLTPHFPWYYEQEFLDELKQRDILKKRYQVKFTQQISQLKIPLLQDDFLPAWVSRPIYLGELLWFSTLIEEKLNGLKELLTFAQGSQKYTPLIRKFFPPAIKDAAAAKNFLKQQGGWLNFIVQLLKEHHICDLTYQLHRITAAQNTVLKKGDTEIKTAVMPLIGIIKKDLQKKIDQAIKEIELVAQIARTVKNCWSPAEWRLLGVNPQTVADSLEIIQIKGY